MLVRSILVLAGLWLWVILLTLLSDVRMFISFATFVDRRGPCSAFEVANGDKRRLARFTTLLRPGSWPMRISLRMLWRRMVRVSEDRAGTKGFVVVLVSCLSCKKGDRVLPVFCNSLSRMAGDV